VRLLDTRSPYAELNPATTGATQVPYSYTAAATIPGGGTFSYSLVTRPTGMTINAASGVISWTPTASQAGSYPVVVAATGGGYSNRQSFTIVTTASPVTFISTPVTTAKVGVPYSYTAVASMTGGGTFTYSLTVRPTAAMTINASTGVISWTPTAAFVGTRPVTVRAVKGASSGTQSFNIVVSP